MRFPSGDHSGAPSSLVPSRRGSTLAAVDLRTHDVTGGAVEGRVDDRLAVRADVRLGLLDAGGCGDVVDVRAVGLGDPDVAALPEGDPLSVVGDGGRVLEPGDRDGLLAGPVVFARMRVAHAHLAADVDDPAVLGPGIGAARRRRRASSPLQASLRSRRPAFSPMSFTLHSLLGCTRAPYASFPEYAARRERPSACQRLRLRAPCRREDRGWGAWLLRRRRRRRADAEDEMPRLTPSGSWSLASWSTSRRSMRPSSCSAPGFRCRWRRRRSPFSDWSTRTARRRWPVPSGRPAPPCAYRRSRPPLRLRSPPRPQTLRSGSSSTSSATAR